MRIFAYAVALCMPVALLAQEPNPTSNATAVAPTGGTPIFKVEVVSRSIQAISYRNHDGWTKVDFQGTSLAPKSKGTIDVNSRLGHMEIKVDVKDLPAASTFGNVFLTYVLWAITPDGHAANLGEVVSDSGGDFKGNVTTELQSFGLIITAEPYFAVRQPSDVVVMENIIRQDTRGKYETVDAKYELLPRGQYTYHVPEGQQHPIVLDSNKKNPLEVYEAMNAIQIGRYALSDKYAADVFQNAEGLLHQAQDYEARKQWNPAIMTAKEATQKAEDARVISLRKQQQESLDKERADAAARTAAAQQQAAEEARQRQLADEQAKRDAEQRAAAEKAKAESDALRAQADEASARANSEAQKAQAAAAEADKLRQQAVADKNGLREQLLQQFNAVLPTVETVRGLVVNMQDVLFDTGKYSLKEPAKLALARIAGIIVSHPGLNLQVEGYTDSTGGDELNQKLSDNRANAVRDFLGQQGLNPAIMTSIGYGKTYPVATNDTAAGRAQNRRVELVVSGEVIGVKIGAPPSAGGMQPPASGMAPPAGPPR